MKRTTYTLWSLDVWGNAEEGFEVNDRSAWSRDFVIEHEGDAPTDAEVLRALFNAGYLNEFVPHRRTKNRVTADVIETHIAANDQLSGESTLLKGFIESEGIPANVGEWVLESQGTDEVGEYYRYELA